MAVPRGPPAQHMRRYVESCQKKSKSKKFLAVEQLRQLGDIGRDPPRLMGRQCLRSSGCKTSPPNCSMNARALTYTPALHLRTDRDVRDSHHVLDVSITLGLR
jgi:hypothetical protein